MRAVLHLCAVALVAPQALVVSAFLLLSHLTAGHTLGSLVSRLWTVVTAFFGWGGLAALVAVAVLAGAGFSKRARPFASAAVILLAAVSGTIFVVQLGVETAVREMALLVPGLAGIAVSASILRLDLRPETPAARESGSRRSRPMLGDERPL